MRKMSLILYLKDRNDEKPQFNQTVYNAQVYENSTTGKTMICL